MKYLAGAAIVLFILIAGGLIYVYSGIFDVSAMVPHSKLTLWALNTARDRSIAHNTDNDVKVPDLRDSSLIKMGFVHYREMCISCHGAPGVERDEIGKGLYPRGPNLSNSAKEFSPQQLFWITRNGLKMSGMPAFGKTHPDDKIWAIVAFTKKLANMSKEQYLEFVKEAK
ncbi:MAG: c-type cytochrome [Clostridiales bacterium]